MVGYTLSIYHQYSTIAHEPHSICIHDDYDDLYFSYFYDYHDDAKDKFSPENFAL